jgi:hypothetical protein
MNAVLHICYWYFTAVRKHIRSTNSSLKKAKGHSTGASLDEISSRIGYGYTLRIIVSRQRPRSCKHGRCISYGVKWHVTAERKHIQRAISSRDNAKQNKIRIHMNSKIKLFTKITKWRPEYLWASIGYFIESANESWSLCHLQAKMVQFSTFFFSSLRSLFRLCLAFLRGEMVFSCDNASPARIFVLVIGLRGFFFKSSD